MKRDSLRLALALAPAAVAGLATAQTPPIDAGRAAQEAQPLRPAEPRQQPNPTILQQEDRPLALPAGRTLRVDSFVFEGADGIPAEELQAAVASYKGRDLAMPDIEAVADRVTALLREKGYLVARALVPRQDASGGALRIRVVIGTYGKVSVQNRSLVNDASLSGYFSDLGGSKTVTRQDLERSMLLVGELPGATLPKVTVAAASEPGASDFVAQVEPGPRYGAYLLGDNFGSRYTGRNRLTAGGTVNSPAGIGDRIDAYGMSSSNGDLRSGRIAYAAPLGSQGLRGEVAASRTTYELGSIYAPLGALGTARSLEANLSYALQRSRTQNLTVLLNLVDRRLYDAVQTEGSATTKHARAATLGASLDRFGQLFSRDAAFSATGSVTWGRLRIDEPAMAAANRAGANTVGGYGRFNLGLAGRVALSDALSAHSALDVQRSIRRNLDSSEQLLISGTRGVTAYESAASGDDGYLVKAELRYALPALPQGTHAVNVFTNLGRVSLHDAGFTTTNGVRLSDVGIGYTVSWRALYARLQAARAIGARPAPYASDDRTRVLVQLGLMI
ncbi:hemolysin activation/secretion protein [Pseudorhodoferax soli]|uniref:Hemolysin activation/secretion protein n=2 Tax=Pseudorhodoferax soli TaxID=545864 RepID=A0A368XR77_9BURK|nr:hemolysin activation/secretion protein [Pseudorhodoferax soli]